MNSNRLTLLFLTCIFLCTSASAGDQNTELNIVQGVVVFKVTSEYKVDLPVDGAYRFGVSHIDLFMDKINATRVERKFPHCHPPKPGGTDLTRIYNLYFPDKLSVKKVVAGLSKLKGIEYAEPWYLVPVYMDYNDPDFDEQYAMELIEASSAHDIATGDRTVAVAISDLGIDMDHEDLEDNLWINPGEDLNHNGIVDDNERNNRDDDDNGYVDDFHGWDFDEDDNDPEDEGDQGQYAGHGSHCAGIASAVTNNRVGIASIGYSCGILPVKAGGRGGHEAEDYAESVEYAATVGAKVISCSWGPPMDIEVLHDAVDYAHDHDALVVAAAGNLDPRNQMLRPEQRVYPAAYDNVIAVAGTDQDDHKWGSREEGSNYGDWVDISAPGHEILSTYINNDYYVASGTSMATPLVAGVAVLLRATYPDLSVDEIRNLLFEGADDIDDENQDYRGKLGAGRVNAYQSLLLGPMHSLDIGDLEIISDDNDNGKMDPGETVQLAITVSIPENGEMIEDIVVTLESEDDDVNIQTGSFEIDELDAGDSFINNDEPFIVEISGDVEPHTTWLTVSVESEAADIQDAKTFEMIIGHPHIFIVDDDGGADVEDIYFDALDNSEMGWARWDVAEREEPPAEDMISDYEMVIWITGNDQAPLDNLDRWELSNAIEQGANVLLIGEYIGDDHLNSELLQNYFSALHQADIIRSDTVRGIENGSPLGSNIVLSLGNELFDSESPSSMIAIDGGGEVVEYISRNEGIGIAGVYRTDQQTGSRTIYLGFALEAIDSDIEQNIMSYVLSHLYGWFIGESSVFPNIDPVTEAFALEPTYPNPFNGVVSINFNLPIRTDYRLTIVDVFGRQITALGNTKALAGSYFVNWNANSHPSGMYFARLSIPGRAPIESKLVLVK
ncbi:MAG: S8 family serine peptidase [Candidatus Hatepunaea meridiana]|nr:S8 family serine peptidase [Candidatus Hatepunaea meridiana]